MCLDLLLLLELSLLRLDLLANMEVLLHFLLAWGRLSYILTRWSPKSFERLLFVLENAPYISKSLATTQVESLDRLALGRILWRERSEFLEV